jgi:hypothetical protein
MQGAKKRLEFAEGKRPATASDLSRLQRQQQQDEADSECSASVASRATGRGQQLYERGMEMKHRQEQIRDQLRQVCPCIAAQCVPFTCYAQHCHLSQVLNVVLICFG